MARGGTPGNRRNPNPAAGRLAKKAHAKPGNLEDVQALVWAALCKAQALMEKPEQKDDLCLRAVNAIGQVAMSYAKLLEVGEYEARLAAVEAALRHLEEDR
jgi:hypothetical protein